MTNTQNTTAQTVVAVVRGSHSGNAKKKAERTGHYSVTLYLLDDNGQPDARPEARKEWGDTLEGGTTQQSILEGIAAAFGALKRDGINVIVQTSSDYAINVLKKNWKPKKNLEFIVAAHKAMAAHTVTFEKI